jgi:hypothetical protein
MLLALGTIESLDLKTVPKPDHDIDDVITVTLNRAGIVDELYVLDGFTLGFGSGGLLDITGRQITPVAA